jgi:short-subunit dehydrogenase
MEKNCQLIRHVLITGGANGLGKEITLMLLKEGHSVIVLDKLPKYQIPEEFIGKLLDYWQVDLADLSQVRQVLEKCITDAQIKVDVFIANASPRIFKHFLDFSSQAITEITHASLTGHVLFMNGFLSSMLENNYGRIIVISSKSGVRGYSTGSMYSSLKSALITFHESLEKELKSYQKNVTITTICPDSFSDTLGKPLRHYESIINQIKKQILKSLTHKHSRLLFVAAFPGKLGIAFQYFHKLLRVFYDF